MYPVPMKPIRYVRQSNFLLPFPLFWPWKADVNSFMIQRETQSTVKDKKILYTGKVIRKLTLNLTAAYICKLLIPLVPRGPNTTSAQPLMRLYSVQYTSEFLLPLIFFIVSPLQLIIQLMLFLTVWFVIPF